MFMDQIGQAEQHKVGPYVLMFLDHVRSLRNITTYVPQPGQEAEEHKMGSYVPRPGRGT
jgi:hypothetical protein